MTTKNEIKSWLEYGQAQGATHMIVVCDTFDYEDYPVYVKPGEDPRKVAEKYQDFNRMSRVMEVYSYRYPIADQLKEERAFHYD